MRDITVDHGQIFVLAAAVEAEPKPKPIGQRYLFLDRFAWIDRG